MYINYYKFNIFIINITNNKLKIIFKFYQIYIIKKINNELKA